MGTSPLRETIGRDEWRHAWRTTGDSGAPPAGKQFKPRRSRGPSLLVVAVLLLLTGCSRWQPLPSMECDEPPIGCFRRDEPVIMP
jgi:hypothetical protein